MLAPMSPRDIAMICVIGVIALTFLVACALAANKRPRRNRSSADGGVFAVGGDAGGMDCGGGDGGGCGGGD